MACSCHGKKGQFVKKVMPYDQCSACAKKHIVKAWTLYNQFTYRDDDRDFISGQLRNAVDHLMYQHRILALKVRNLAIKIEQAKDQQIDNQWEQILNQIRLIYYTDYPQVLQRLNILKEKKES